MAKSKSPLPEKISASLSVDQIRAAIPKLQKRFNELKAVNITNWNEETRQQLDALQLKVEDTLHSIFGANTHEYDRFRVRKFYLSVPMNIHHRTPPDEWAAGYARAINGAISKIDTAITLFAEKLEDVGAEPGPRALRAFRDLDLHPEIQRAASKLYLDGHYANSVQDAVKALNQLVRLRSGIDHLDGSALMTQVFSPKNPILRFNSLAGKSEVDEQLGFMMLFSGAVVGLRNPRAHSFIQDDPERTLEFIAFVSLLAKLLDSAEKA